MAPPGDTAVEGDALPARALSLKKCFSPMSSCAAGAAPSRAQPVSGRLTFFWALTSSTAAPGAKLHLFLSQTDGESGCCECPSPASCYHPRASHPGTSSHPTPKIPSSGCFLCFRLIFSLPLGAGSSPLLEEARGTALGPCYILFQKAIADISTTFTTARDILCYKGFQKHKPPELNTYSMASRGRFRVFRD